MCALASWTVLIKSVILLLRMTQELRHSPDEFFLLPGEPCEIENSSFNRQVPAVGSIHFWVQEKR